MDPAQNRSDVSQLGALRAPSFKGWHLDKNDPDKVKEAMEDVGFVQKLRQSEPGLDRVMGAAGKLEAAAETMRPDRILEAAKEAVPAFSRKARAVLNIAQPAAEAVGVQLPPIDKMATKRPGPALMAESVKIATDRGYGPGGKWIHDRAHGMMGDMEEQYGEKGKQIAYAVATQQAHAVKKSPKDFRTSAGVREAKAKFDSPKEMKKTAAPRHIQIIRELAQAGKMDEVRAMVDQLVHAGVLKVSPQGTNIKRLGGGAEALADLVVGAGDPKLVAKDPMVVRKVYDQLGAIYSPEALSEKVNAQRRLQHLGLDENFAKLYGGIRKTPGGARFTLHEFVQGGQHFLPEDQQKAFGNILRNYDEVQRALAKKGLPGIDPGAARLAKNREIVDELKNRGMSTASAEAKAEKMVPKIGNPELIDLHNENVMNVGNWRREQPKVLDFTPIPAHRIADVAEYIPAAESVAQDVMGSWRKTREHKEGVMRRLIAGLWRARGLPTPPSALGPGGAGIATGPKSGRGIVALLKGLAAPGRPAMELPTPAAAGSQELPNFVLPFAKPNLRALGIGLGVGGAAAVGIGGGSALLSNNKPIEATFSKAAVEESIRRRIRE